jgi:hypothetical protein
VPRGGAGRSTAYLSRAAGESGCRSVAAGGIAPRRTP